MQGPLVLLALSHTRTAALPTNAAGTKTRRCHVRQKCQTCWYGWHPLPHADGSTVGDPLRHDVMVLHRP